MASNLKQLEKRNGEYISRSGVLFSATSTWFSNMVNILHMFLLNLCITFNSPQFATPSVKRYVNKT
jgi:hypothetical protein